MPVQLRAVGETFIARRVKFHDGLLPRPQGAKQPQFTRGQQEDIQFRPVSPPRYSPSVFSSLQRITNILSRKGDTSRVRESTAASCDFFGNLISKYRDVSICVYEFRYKLSVRNRIWETWETVYRFRSHVSERGLDRSSCNSFA